MLLVYIGNTAKAMIIKPVVITAVFLLRRTKRRQALVGRPIGRVDEKEVERRQRPDVPVLVA